MSLASSATDVGTRIGRSTRHGAGRVRTPAFYLVTAGFLAFLAVALGESMAMVATAWGSEYAFPAHRVHHAVIGGTLTVFAATIAIQLYRPTKRVGALQAAIAFAVAAFAVTLVASGPAAAGGLLVFLVPVLVIAALHPARGHLVPSLERADARLLGLATVGAIGFAVVAAGEYASHATLGDEHVLFGHYEFMTFALASVALFALLSALRPIGWRALAYAGGVVAVLFAAGSLAFPGLEQGSSLGPVAAVAVIVWAVAFVALAEHVDRTDSRDAERTAEPER
ncbi:hypothetical protein [Natrarchaeobius oligotrophus]|uniref:Uncharacterized protein n=1 Tax=Natrarchaeobius chitinivorans TaxID=1679083 RepID=A0A3N6PNY9_NATCH|nr:hypothetical protein [Natrarchaeobius chitinivorans]RQH00836.1 hypothetical protein EA472_09385 [Natrarchaeobius chitinivorans]